MGIQSLGFRNLVKGIIADLRGCYGDLEPGGL